MISRPQFLLLEASADVQEVISCERLFNLIISFDNFNSAKVNQKRNRKIKCVDIKISYKMAFFSSIPNFWNVDHAFENLKIDLV